MFNKEKEFYLEFNLTNSTIYCKQNVALFVILRNTNNDNDLYLIVCTHLLFNKNRGDIKLGQIYQITKSIQKIKKLYKDSNLKIIMGCDLNSTPNSAVYELITKGKLNCEKLKTNTLSGQKLCEFTLSTFSQFKEALLVKTSIYEKTQIVGNQYWYDEICKMKPYIEEQKQKIELTLNKDKEETNLILTNSEVLSSAYKTVLQQNIDSIDEDFLYEPQITYYSKGYAGTFDFIFHSNNILPVHVTEIPLLKNFTSIHTGIPNRTYPSDHLPLCVDFEF